VLDAGGRNYGNFESGCRGGLPIAYVGIEFASLRVPGKQATASARTGPEVGAGKAPLSTTAVRFTFPRTPRNEIMNSTNATILVIAEIGDRDSITRTLGAENYQIQTAETADHAARLLDQPIDLVICDLCLDGTDCHDLMQQWHGQQPSTPFILVTGADQIAEAVRVMQHGAADYITKPINPAELVVRVAKWLENSRKQQRLQQLESRFDGGEPHEGHYGSTIDIPAGTSLEDLERVAVERALELHRGNRTHAARTLGISVRTLQRKLKAWRVPVLSLQNHSRNEFSIPVMQ
jgi:DNA-binding NtrC family response regulator